MGGLQCLASDFLFSSFFLPNISASETLRSRSFCLYLKLSLKQSEPNRGSLLGTLKHPGEIRKASFSFKLFLVSKSFFTALLAFCWFRRICFSSTTAAHTTKAKVISPSTKEMATDAGNWSSATRRLGDGVGFWTRNSQVEPINPGGHSQTWPLKWV